MPVTKLSDYLPPEFLISHVDLKFDLDDQKTTVTSSLHIKRQNSTSITPLVLDGSDDLDLISISLNGRLLNASEYQIKDQKLTLLDTPAGDFKLTLINTINPSTNTKLQGLYLTDNLLSTHCEPEGFRNIIYYLDRPDVLATFTTEIHADKTKFPVLLSNGNLIRNELSSENPDRHSATFENPVPIPSYLYAMVAGNLALRQDEFVTRSGKHVALKIFVPEADLPKTRFAMDALKAAMRFDEEHYDREYELDVYNIVGVPKFNAGACENKGLNIFNTTSLLADSDISTDEEFDWVYGCVGHEYFHNWRGNRVTVKNWFQLSLKEGFASVTDQEFSQTIYNSMVPRIQDILVLQNRQFKEDAGPMAHPVLPTEYEATDNIYTMTIYRKGAELINMLRTLIGKEAYKQGCNLYFSEHDGKAAHIEDFLKAMEKASHRDLSQFLLWYQQAGTPQLEIEGHYDAANRTYQLTLSQSCLPTPGQSHKSALLIPVSVALFDKAGHELPLQLDTEEKPVSSNRVLELTEARQTFTFVGIDKPPVPSLLRNFSAPVNITRSPLTRSDHVFLLEHDTDPVNRWFAAQFLFREAIQSMILDIKSDRVCSVDKSIIQAFRAALLDPAIDPLLKSELINFPKENSFFETMKPADPDIIYRARECFIEHFVTSCYDVLKSTYEGIAATPVPDGYTPEAVSLRALKNRCLNFLWQSNRADAIGLCVSQLEKASNMTDTVGALSPLATHYREEHLHLRQETLDKFITKWKHEPIVLQYVFNLYAFNKAPDAIDQIKHVYNSSIFDKKNPSHTLDLLRRFYLNNVKFHDISGKGYQFIADCIVELDKINPSTASELAPAFGNWNTLEPVRQGKMLEQLFRLNALPLSDNVKEIVSKSVKEALEYRGSQPCALSPFGLFKPDETQNTREEKRSDVSVQTLAR